MEHAIIFAWTLQLLHKVFKLDKELIRIDCTNIITRAVRRVQLYLYNQFIFLVYPILIIFTGISWTLADVLPFRILNSRIQSSVCIAPMFYIHFVCCSQFCPSMVLQTENNYNMRAKTILYIWKVVVHLKVKANRVFLWRCTKNVLKYLL